jgi:hypothetical protein
MLWISDQKQKPRAGGFVFGATEGIFRLGFGLLALRAVQSLACALRLLKTPTQRLF